MRTWEFTVKKAVGNDGDHLEMPETKKLRVTDFRASLLAL